MEGRIVDDGDGVQYVSIDTERLGSDPTAPDPMIQLAAVAWDANGEVLGEFSANIRYEPGSGDQETVDGWKNDAGRRTMFENMHIGAMSPEQAMRDFRYWLGNRRPTLFVCYPTITDGTWLYQYWFKYLGHPHKDPSKPPFSVIDLQSYAAGKLGIDYREATRSKALKPFFPLPSEPDLPVHYALADARQKMQLFWNIHKAPRGGGGEQSSLGGEHHSLQDGENGAGK